MSPRHQHGFTLIEVMIVVALLGVLAAIAIPSFWGTSEKAKIEAEVAPMFAELGMRQDQYKLENGQYLSTSSSETATFPSAPSATAINIANSLPSAWTTLKVDPPNPNVRCAYVTIAGGPSSANTPGSKASEFGFVAPQGAWWYNLARCDLDRNPALDSYYFNSSLDPTIRKQAPGK